jgi:hypothetical protein
MPRHAHALVSTTTGGWFCNICRSQNSARDARMRCSACDWDECAACYPKNSGKLLRASVEDFADLFDSARLRQRTDAIGYRPNTTAQSTFAITDAHAAALAQQRAADAAAAAAANAEGDDVGSPLGSPRPGAGDPAHVRGSESHKLLKVRPSRGAHARLHAACFPVRWCRLCSGLNDTAPSVVLICCGVVLCGVLC